MNYWLMKTEPTTFGIEHLKKTPNQTTFWDGVRNYQARNMLRDQMKKGDLAFFYHSNCSDLGVVAIIEVVSNGEIDPTQFNSTSPYYDIKSFPDKPRWYGVKESFARCNYIKTIKNESTIEKYDYFTPWQSLVGNASFCKRMASGFEDGLVFMAMVLYTNHE